MNRIDIMVDIETLGTKSDSTIIQIAAIAFDIHTGRHIEKFNQKVDITKNEKLNVSGSTIKWWLNTNKELLAEIINTGVNSSDQVLINFHNWLNELQEDKNLYLWGNGILFDNKMIQHQFENLGLSYPIYYRNDRDLRTLLDLASNKTGLSEIEIRNSLKDDILVEHDAYDDVIYQIKLAVYCYNCLIK